MLNCGALVQKDTRPRSEEQSFHAKVVHHAIYFNNFREIIAVSQ